MDPYDALREMVGACGKKQNINAIGKALGDARRLFNLNTKEQIFDFINSGGLESPEFINEKPWEQDPNQKDPATVYAFGFFSGPKRYGYIAFMQTKQTGFWLIKSFKMNTRSDPRNPSSREQLVELKRKLEGK